MHATICDCFADAVQNAIEAGAMCIEASIQEDGETVSIVVSDNGSGMDAETLKRVWDPFYSDPGKHAARRVGLGLPLLRQMAEAAGGTVAIDSERGRGTRLVCRFSACHMDTPPMGDLPGTVMVLMNTDGAFELALTRARGAKAYTVRRSELREVLGDLCDVDNLVLIRDYVNGLEADL